MKLTTKLFIFLSICLLMSSCLIPKAQYELLQTELTAANSQIGECGEKLNDYMAQVSACEREKEKLKGDLRAAQATAQSKDQQISDLKEQIGDIRGQRDKQVEQVGDLTVLSQSANENIKETLSQLERKDKYINAIAAAKTKADSINLALAVNLTTMLKDGIADEDVEIKVDKTVVYINLSDKMLYTSGSATITSRADEVLSKIAQIVTARPEVEVMVEGYTDNVPISNSCLTDNWDLSVKRATSVVRALQTKHNIDPNRLVAAGRGQYNTLASNDTAEGRSTNRRTRIIILPKLDQFYDLLDPNQVPE
ncbi:MAG: OmpA family protein [Saprospiraceae bacterium]